MKLKKLLGGLTALAVLTVLSLGAMPSQSNAATMTDGGSYTLSQGETFSFTGLAGDYIADEVSFMFEGSSFVDGIAASSSLSFVSGGLSSITATWSTGAYGTGTLLDSIVVPAGSGFGQATLPTNFTTVPTQWFTTSWVGNDPDALISVQVGGVTPIPVPAALPLLLALLAALGGFGLRKRHAAMA